MKLRGALGALLAAACAGAAAQPAPASCAPQAFTLSAGPHTGRFDVAQLRRERPELYAIIASRFFQRSGLGEELAKLMRPLDLLGPVRDTGDASMERFFRFLGTDAIPGAVRDMLLACGSIADAAAAELSRQLTPEEARRIAVLITDPAFDKLADALPINIVRNPEPPELAASTRAAMEAARLRIVADCQAAGVPRCETLQFLPPARQR